MVSTESVTTKVLFRSRTPDQTCNPRPASSVLLGSVGRGRACRTTLNIKSAASWCGSGRGLLTRHTPGDRPWVTRALMLRVSCHRESRGGCPWAAERSACAPSATALRRRTRKGGAERIGAGRERCGARQATRCVWRDASEAAPRRTGWKTDQKRSRVRGGQRAKVPGQARAGVGRERRRGDDEDETSASEVQQGSRSPSSTEFSSSTPRLKGT